jgi:hypothetical protein
MVFYAHRAQVLKVREEHGLGRRLRSLFARANFGL